MPSPADFVAWPWYWQAPVGLLAGMIALCLVNLLAPRYTPPRPPNFWKQIRNPHDRS